MKINTLKKLPIILNVAFSGGMDSSVLLDVCDARKCSITLLTFDHKTVTSDEEISFAQKTSKQYDVPLIIGNTPLTLQAGDSKERFWSECRNIFFNSQSHPVATGHNLNDAVEWYLMSALVGSGGHYMNYQNKNVIRPLLTTSRQTIEEYCLAHDIKHIVDQTNFDVNFNKRNMVRHALLPCVLKVNPGILNTVKRNIIRKTFTPVL